MITTENPVDGDAYGNSERFAEAEAQRLKIMDAWLTRFSAIIIGNGPQRVIDIGAGSGRSLERFIKQNGGAYYALDSTKQIVDERLEQQGPEHIILGEASKLPIKDLYLTEPTSS